MVIQTKPVQLPACQARRPLHADARSDEGPPFEVLSSLPLLGIASILSSAEGSAEGGDAAPGAAEAGSQQRHASDTLDSAIPEVSLLRLTVCAAPAELWRSAHTRVECDAAVSVILIDSRMTVVSGNPRCQSDLEQVIEVHPLAVRDVSVQCALEDSCLVFFDDTSMSDALAAFDDTGKTVGMVQVGPACRTCSTCARSACEPLRRS